MQSLSDEACIRRIREGDILAYEYLVKRYERPLKSFVYRIVRSIHESEEIVQDTLFSVYIHIGRIDPTKKISSYIFAIAKNTAISYLRKKKQTTVLTDDMAVMDDTFLYEQLVQDETFRKIRHVLHTMEEKYRRVIELYYFEDRSYEEMSVMMHIPINTVRTHLRRAKGIIKKRYER